MGFHRQERLKKCSVLPWQLCSLITFASALALHAEIAAASLQVPWGYFENQGAAKWGQLDPSFALCSNGKSQSPINLVPKNMIPLEAKKMRLTFEYQPSPLEIENTGQLLKINLKTPSKLKQHRKDYNLIQIHFHSPSEHLWEGNPFPMEMHLVHRSEKGEIAIVAAFIREGQAHPELNKILSKIPNKGEKHIDLNTLFIPSSLLPPKGGFVSYEGSLTIPPCSEGVRWYVLTSPLSMSREQITSVTSAHAYNARPVQSNKQRKVFLMP